MAFDGTTSRSVVVQAAMIFLDKRFRGRFVIVDSEIGVIGRNILKRVAILMDGPASTWDEVPTGSRGV